MTDELPAFRVTASAVTDVGRVRTNNEDAFTTLELASRTKLTADAGLVRTAVGPRGALIAVSDGMGGARAGEVASTLALATLEETLATSDATPELALRGGVERANLAVFEAGRDPSMQGMGATMTAVLLHGTTAYIAGVGDSRAYLLRGGRFRQMTRDQSYVQVLVDAGILKPEEAEASPMKNVILQSMGQKPEVQVALGRLELRRGDRLLLCSDGLTGHVKDEEIAEVLRDRDASVDELARSLVELALERGGEDNVTVLVADVDGTSLPVAPLPESVTQTFRVLSEFEPGIAQAKKNAANQAAKTTAPNEPEAPVAPPPAPRRNALVSFALVAVALVGVVAWLVVRS